MLGFIGKQYKETEIIDFNKITLNFKYKLLPLAYLATTDVNKCLLLFYSLNYLKCTKLFLYKGVRNNTFCIYQGCHTLRVVLKIFLLFL